MFSRTSDRQCVKKFEVVEVKALHQRISCPVSCITFEPFVEACLGFLESLLNTRDSSFRQSVVDAFSNECDLVLQVIHAIVYWCRREHQDFRLYPGLDDFLHQATVTCDPILLRRVVSEVVRLVDHDQVVVAPVERLQVDVARHSFRPG